MPDGAKTKRRRYDSDEGTAGPPDSRPARPVFRSGQSPASAGFSASGRRKAISPLAAPADGVSKVAAPAFAPAAAAGALT